MNPREQAEMVRKLPSTIESWLKEEGHKVERPAPQPTDDFVFIVDMPNANFKFQIVRRKGAHSIMMGTTVNLSPEHIGPLQAMPQDRRAKTAIALRRAAWNGAVVGFGPAKEGDVIKGWSLDVGIWDDGLTQHEFNRAIRQLLTKHLELIDALNEELGLKNGVPQGGAMPGYF